MNLKKAVNHGGHSEKARDCIGLTNRPSGEIKEKSETKVFRRARRGLN